MKVSASLPCSHSPRGTFEKSPRCYLDCVPVSVDWAQLILAGNCVWTILLGPLKLSLLYLSFYVLPFYRSFHHDAYCLIVSSLRYEIRTVFVCAINMPHECLSFFRCENEIIHDSNKRSECRECARFMKYHPWGRILCWRRGDNVRRKCHKHVAPYCDFKSFSFRRPLSSAMPPTRLTHTQIR